MTALAIPSVLSTLHLLGHFNAAFTGAEREVLDMQRLLAGRRAVKVWSESPPHASYAGQSIATIQPFAQQFPKDGTLLIAGAHIRPGIWLKYTRFEHVVLFCNLAHHLQLFSMIENLRDATRCDPELVFASDMLQLSVGLPGRVARSLIDLQLFLEIATQRFQKSLTAKAHKPFTVGRLSRDALDKHHPDDPVLYRMLASRGIRVRIMGGTCLEPGLRGVEGIELLAAGAEPATEFYRSLDVFLYRTGASTEAYGRVVAEAMATGLPVVAQARGGYAEVIENRVSGFLFQTQEEAYDAVLVLKASSGLREQVGHAAMRQALALHGPQAVERDLAFYLR